LISVDCWDTILANPRHLDERIDQLIAEFIHDNHRSLPWREIESVIAAEAREFLYHLKQADSKMTSTDRAMRVLAIAGIGKTDPCTRRGLADSLNDMIDGALLEFPTEPLPGAIEFLQHAAACAIPVAMVSNTGWLSPRAVTSTVGNLALDTYFSDLLFSGDGYLPKPDAQMFKLLLDQHRCHPAQAVHVGDNPDTDQAGARRIGMHSITLSREVDSNPGVVGELEGRVRCRVGSLQEAISIVNTLGSGS